MVHILTAITNARRHEIYVRPTAAGATVARLHADETFASQMAKAKKGLEKHFDKSHTEKKQSKKLSNNNIET